MSADDFGLLWPICVERIYKRRYEKRIGDMEWVVDFLLDASDAVYFVLAEVEMPRHQIAPETIPAEIRDHIVHAVAAESNRFTNKKLADTAYARAAYAGLTVG